MTHPKDHVHHETAAHGAPRAKRGHETTASPVVQRLTDDDQSLLVSYPVHTAAEIKSYVRPARGLDKIAASTTAFLRANPDVAKALKLDADALDAEVAEAAKLDRPTTVAYQLYRRGYENAMERRSDVTRAVLKVNRPLRAERRRRGARARHRRHLGVGERHARPRRRRAPARRAAPAGPDDVSARKVFQTLTSRSDALGSNPQRVTSGCRRTDARTQRAAPAVDVVNQRSDAPAARARVSRRRLHAADAINLEP